MPGRGEEYCFFLFFGFGFFFDVKKIARSPLGLFLTSMFYWIIATNYLEEYMEIKTSTSITIQLM